MKALNTSRKLGRLASTYLKPSLPISVLPVRSFAKVESHRHPKQIAERNKHYHPLFEISSSPFFRGWEPASTIAKDFGDFFTGGELHWPNEKSDWHPHVDISEGEQFFTISADLPGIKKEDIKVAIKKNYLTLEGHRHEEKNEDSNSQVRRQEKFYGTFMRKIKLPDNAHTKGLKAKYDHGVLTLTIPKKDADEDEFTFKIE